MTTNGFKTEQGRRNIWGHGDTSQLYFGVKPRRCPIFFCIVPTKFKTEPSCSKYLQIRSGATAEHKAGCCLALPCPALQWWQLDFDCISFILKVFLTTFYSNIFCFSDFFLDETDRMGRKDGQTDTGTFLRKCYFK